MNDEHFHSCKPSNGRKVPADLVLTVPFDEVEREMRAFLHFFILTDESHAWIKRRLDGLHNLISRP